MEFWKLNLKEIGFLKFNLKEIKILEIKFERNEILEINRRWNLFEKLFKDGTFEINK